MGSKQVKLRRSWTFNLLPVNPSLDHERQSIHLTKDLLNLCHRAY